jgi:hypothetical protein
MACMNASRGPGSPRTRSGANQEPNQAPPGAADIWATQDVALSWR